MNEMKIQIPTQLIEDTIRMEMVRNLSEENKDTLIKNIVESAMKHKKDNYSYSKTYFQEEITKMIQKEAKEIFSDWIEKNRQDIAKALKTYLATNKQKMLTTMCENLANNISSYGIGVNLNLRHDD